MLADAKSRGVDLVLPTDIVVAPRFAADAPPSVVAADAIPEGTMGLDIGPQARELFTSRLADAKTVFWNGPMGVFEFPAFAAGTRAVAEALTKVDGLGPWSAAAATRPRRCGRSGSTRRPSGTSPPAAAPRSSTWKARHSPASRPWKRKLPATMTDTKKLPLIAGNWKMHNNHFEAIALVQKLAFSLSDKDYKHVEVVVLPPDSPTCARCRRWRTATSSRSGTAPSEHSRQQRPRRLHRRDRWPPMLAKLGCSHVLQRAP